MIFLKSSKHLISPEISKFHFLKSKVNVLHESKFNLKKYH
jgi:hypothetical protein